MNDKKKSAYSRFFILLFLLNFLFLGYQSPNCMKAADANDDGIVDISDGIYTLNFLFSGGKDISAPYPSKGFDPTPDALGCRR